MTLTQQSDQTASSGSSPQLTWKVNLPSGVIIKNNTKLYYNKFGHVLTVSKHTDWRDHKEHNDWRMIMHKLKETIHHSKIKHVIRMEWSTLRIFTNDVEDILKIMPPKILKENLDSVGIMRDDVRASLMEKPDTYRSVYTVVKKLPWDQYRHKVYYVNDARHKRMIGKDALEAIAQQISQTPGVKWTRKHQDNCSSLSHSYDAPYFYSTDLDWLPMVMLINPRFIKKIEHIKLESEIE